MVLVQAVAAVVEDEDGLRRIGQDLVCAVEADAESREWGSIEWPRGHTIAVARLETGVRPVVRECTLPLVAGYLYVPPQACAMRPRRSLELVRGQGGRRSSQSCA